MQRNKPTKQDIIDELQRIQARDGGVTRRTFKKDTGWSEYWFDRHWPETGYDGACHEAGVTRGAIIGVEANLRVNDEEIAMKLAGAIERIKKFPGLTQFAALSKLGVRTIVRDGIYNDAEAIDSSLFSSAEIGAAR